MSVLTNRGGYRPSFNLSPDQLEQMRRLWEGMPELSARAIAAEFGVTRNTVIGQANRRGWKARPSPLTLSRQTREKGIIARLDALDVFPAAGGCVYPIGHPREAGFRFCAARVTEVGAPYCPECSRRAWQGAASAKQREAWEAAGPERRLMAAARARNAGKARRPA
jgi:hypothetical protein